MPKDGGHDTAGSYDTLEAVSQDTGRNLELVHYGRAHREADVRGDLIRVPEESPQNQDFLIGRPDVVPGDQISVLQSATDFDINGGNFATVGGDFFTATRDLHVTIHNHPSSLVRNDDQESRDLSSHERRQGDPDQAVLPPLPVQRSCDIYRRHLASKGRGIPLWIPEPNKNLPIQYQRNGIAIGDVGIFTASGSFAFLFNICLPHDHPINPPNLPENFRPIHVPPVNIHSQSEFKQNSYLASASTVRTQSDGDSTGLIFESSAHDGAVLTMPVGSISEDLGSTGRFRKYVAANMVHWYNYAYHDREYDVKNGDLRLVIGHDKTSFWGMATFSNSTSQQESFQLKFGLMEGRKYGWEYSGMAEVRAGPDIQEIEQLRGNDPTQEDINYTNQCLFVRTMNATLPDKVWDELGIDTEDLELEVDSDLPTYPSKEAFGGGGFSNTKSSVFHKSNETGTKMNSSTSRSDNVMTVFSTGTVYSSPLTLADHPSKAINSMLLENCRVGVKMAITDDQDWMSVISENDYVLPSSQEIVDRIRESYTICEEEGVVFLSKVMVPVRSINPVDSLTNDLEEKIDIKANSILSLANIPNLSNALHTLSSNQQEISRVKLYKLHCKATIDRCIYLINGVMESSYELDSHLMEIVDQVEFIATRIDKSVKEWASWNRLRSFLRQGEITEGLNRIDRDIDGASIKFNIVSHIRLKAAQQAAQQDILRQQVEMREALQAIITSSEDMKSLLNMQDPRSVENVMGSLQTELLDPASAPLESGQDIKKDFRDGLWMLHEKTSKLPPLADLTGQVTNLLENPTGTTSHKIHIGRWLDHETVYLRLVKGLKDPAIQRRFEMEVSTWRQLKHPNVLPIYGFTRMDSEIYTVSPWMEEGNVIAFIKKNPDTDRLKIVTDIAAGLECLHHNGIVHGDLRGTNVMFSTNGIACLSDFGIAKFIEDVLGNKDMAINVRWMAPEVIQQGSSVSMYSDVWSFAMLCLEVLTGNQPYSNIQRDVAVLREIENSRTPPRPEAGVSLGVSDGMWRLLQRCWAKEPKARPSMSYVRSQLLDFRGFGISMNNQPSILKSPLQGGRTHQSARPATARSTLSQASSLDTVDRDISSVAFSKPSTASSNMTSLDQPPHIEALGNNRLMKLPHYRESADDSFTEALLDPQAIVNVTDGAVLSGTLRGLVLHLVTCNFNSLQDNEYGAVFLTALPDFTTPEAFFSILSRCFYDAESNPNMRTAERVEHQYNIFTILAHWLSHEDLKFDWRLGQEISNFCVEAMHIKSSTMSNKAKDLLQLLKGKGRVHHAERPGQGEPEETISHMLAISGNKALRPSEITPHEMAIALTILEGEKYKSLTPSDYLAHLGRHPGHNNIQGVYTTNNKIMLWVKHTVLRCNDTTSRANTLKFFINTATECRKLRNFSSMVAIATSLHSDPIERLRVTRMEVTSQMHTKLAALKEIIDVTGNHRKYREALDDRNADGKQDCVPWLAIHLKDLHNILQRNPMVVNINNRPLINFQRYTKLMDRIKEVLLYQPPNLEAHRQPPVLEYIEKEFLKLELSKVTEDELVARSKKLEAQEIMEHKGRKSQLQSLGFTLGNKF